MNKKFIPISGIVAFFFAMLCMFINIIYFPNEIRLTQNSTRDIILKLPMGFGGISPFSADLETDTVTVINVNNEPINNNINVSLNEPVTISANETGSGQLTLNAFGIPVKKVRLDVLPDTELIPCGLTVGVRINTNGVMVLGSGNVSVEGGKVENPSIGKLQSGDLILSVDGKSIGNKEDLVVALESKKTPDDINLHIKRSESEMDVDIKPVLSSDDKKYKIGVWVRDSTQGIGTVTYYNPSSRIFGALGHGIMDVDTKRLMSVKDGYITDTVITDIRQGNKGAPGELIGKLKPERIIGTVKANTPYGIYGIIDPVGSMYLPSERMKIAFQDQVHEGPAVIMANVDDEVRKYDVFIENVNRYSNDETKGMVLRITDPSLLRKTNGIIQGMSGSPIIQDNKIIGAVTHVFVQDPSKGYGIFIENMLRREKEISAL